MMANRKMRRTARKLADAVTAELTGPVPPGLLCEALCRKTSELRGGRPIELRYVDFPAQTTGLALVLEDHDKILVERSTTGVQQVVIVGHELGHLLEDDHHGYLDGAVAARILGEAGDAEQSWRDVLRVAARDHCQADHEQRVEDFGLALGGMLLPWVADGTQAPGAREGIVGRIQTSLGPY